MEREVVVFHCRSYCISRGGGGVLLPSLSFCGSFGKRFFLQATAIQGNWFKAFKNIQVFFVFNKFEKIYSKHNG